MPIREWTYWDRMSIEDDLWKSVDELEKRRLARLRGDKMGKLLEQRREKAMQKHRIRVA